MKLTQTIDDYAIEFAALLAAASSVPATEFAGAPDDSFISLCSGDREAWLRINLPVFHSASRIFSCFRSKGHERVKKVMELGEGSTRAVVKLLAAVISGSTREFGPISAQEYLALFKNKDASARLLMYVEEAALVAALREGLNHAWDVLRHSACEHPPKWSPFWRFTPALREYLQDTFREEDVTGEAFTAICEKMTAGKYPLVITIREVIALIRAAQRNIWNAAARATRGDVPLDGAKLAAPEKRAVYVDNNKRTQILAALQESFARLPKPHSTIARRYYPDRGVTAKQIAIEMGKFDKKKKEPQTNVIGWYLFEVRRLLKKDFLKTAPHLYPDVERWLEAIDLRS